MIQSSGVELLYEKIHSIYHSKWRAHASCGDLRDDTIFFDPEREQEAKAMCEGCPAKIECGDDSLYYEDQGCRGGMNENERIALILFRNRHNPSFQYDMAPIGEKYEQSELAHECGL